MAVGFPFSFFVCEHLPRFPLQPSPPFATAAATILPLTPLPLSPPLLPPFLLSSTALPPSFPNNGKNSSVPPNASEISFSLYARMKNSQVLPSQLRSLIMVLQYTAHFHWCLYYFIFGQINYMCMRVLYNIVNSWFHGTKRTMRLS